MLDDDPSRAGDAPIALFGLVLSFALGGLAVSAEAADAQANLPPTGFEVGEPFPALALPSLADGEPMSLADFRGHKTIVHVFASW